MKASGSFCLNTRQDRLYRAQQLAEMVALRLEKEIDYLMLIGQSTDVVENMAIQYGIPGKKVISVGWTTPEKVFEKILSVTEKTCDHRSHWKYGRHGC